jgi:hypothetical protein
MLDQDYMRLAELLRGMISDGVLLVHGGHVLDWSDTNILDLLNKIEKEEEKAKSLTCDVGDLLQNVYTGQKSAVVFVDDKNIQLLPIEKIVIFPKDEIGLHYRKSKPGK